MTRSLSWITVFSFSSFPCSFFPLEALDCFSQVAVLVLFLHFILFLLQSHQLTPASVLSPYKKKINYNNEKSPLGRLLPVSCAAALPGIYCLTCPDIPDSLMVNGCDSISAEALAENGTGTRAHTHIQKMLHIRPWYSYAGRSLKGHVNHRPQTFLSVALFPLHLELRKT